jgi:type II secretory pathway pseudopilin PulG
MGFGSLISDGVSHVSEFFNGILTATWAEPAMAVVTAIATIVLALLTWVLARATNAMAKASSQAQVVASLEINQWSLMHMDLVVSNAGNAPAFDIQISFDPAIPDNQLGAAKDTIFNNISILRPGQTLTSAGSDFEAVKDFKTTITTSWRRHPSSKTRETLAYSFDLSGYKNMSVLGRRSPELQMAEEIKKLRDDWKNIASGYRGIKSEIYTQADRDKKQKQQNKIFAEMKSKREGRETISVWHSKLRLGSTASFLKRQRERFFSKSKTG